MENFSIEDAEIENADPPWFRLRAVAVHLYTASGAVLALLILVAAFQGDAVRALWLMLASLIIDSTDGLLARRLRVSEALPFFDGALLDNIVDYMTYVFAPMVLLWSGGYLPVGTPGVVFACSLLVFVPIRYVYPTRTLAFRGLSLALTALWLMSYAAILLQMPEPDPLLLTFSILYLFYYFGLSLYLSSKMLEERRAQETE